MKSTFLSLDRACPRYTSYPAAPHFTSDRGGLYPEWLQTIKDNAPISIYVHIPFCAKMCLYCGCHTKITGRYAPVEDYVHWLRREIAMVAETMKGRHFAAHIHFGGGSPTMLLPHDFRDIMKTIGTFFDITPDTETAIEIDPRTLTQEKVDAYAEAGVNRASLGVQDANDDVLDAVERHQPFEQVMRGTQWLRERGIHKINVDLMYGLPYQTVRKMQRTIDLVALLNPDRLALFGYAHVPWMKKHMTLINENALPDTGLRFDLQECARHELVSAGYQAIGIDHFAKPDDPLTKAMKSKTMHRNFQGYTADDTDILIGFGVSSIGRMPQGYIQNNPNMPPYRDAIEAGVLPAYRGYQMTRDDHIRADVIEQIMCYFEIDLKKISEKYHVPLSYFDDSITSVTQTLPDGTYGLCNSVLRLTVMPHLTARLCAHAFDAHAVHTENRHARAI